MSGKIIKEYKSPQRLTNMLNSVGNSTHNNNLLLIFVIIMMAVSRVMIVGRFRTTFSANVNVRHHSEVNKEMS